MLYEVKTEKNAFVKLEPVMKKKLEKAQVKNEHVKIKVENPEQPRVTAQKAKMKMPARVEKPEQPRVTAQNAKKKMSVRVARDTRLLKKAVQIPRIRFRNLVSAIQNSMQLEHACKLNGEALDALQQAAEGFVTERFSAAYRVHRRVNPKRPTLLLRHFQAVLGTP